LFQVTLWFIYGLGNITHCCQYRSGEPDESGDISHANAHGFQPRAGLGQRDRPVHIDQAVAGDAGQTIEFRRDDSIWKWVSPPGLRRHDRHVLPNRRVFQVLPGKGFFNPCFDGMAYAHILNLMPMLRVRHAACLCRLAFRTGSYNLRMARRVLFDTGIGCLHYLFNFHRFYFIGLGEYNLVLTATLSSSFMISISVSLTPWRESISRQTRRNDGRSGQILLYQPRPACDIGLGSLGIAVARQNPQHHAFREPEEVDSRVRPGVLEALASVFLPVSALTRLDFLRWNVRKNAISGNSAGGKRFEIDPAHDELAGP